jgi:hypothetical protein
VHRLKYSYFFGSIRLQILCQSWFAIYLGLVGATRFERATSCSQSRRSTKLSYAPRPKEPLILAQKEKMPNDFWVVRGALFLRMC